MNTAKRIENLLIEAEYASKWHQNLALEIFDQMIAPLLHNEPIQKVIDGASFVRDEATALQAQAGELRDGGGV